VPLDSEDDGTLRRLADRPRPYPIPRSVGRRAVERAFLNAFELIGGVPRLVLWADAHPGDFYKLYGRLLGGPPQDQAGNITINIEWAGPDRLSYQKTIDAIDV
jgi:hypothetical protein